MASAIGTALIYTFLPPMAAKAKNFTKNKGKGIFRAMADKAMDNIERDISRLQTTLYMFDGIVRVAELKQIDKQGKPRVSIQNWLRDLVDIAYEARDVLDDFITFSSCTITAEEASNSNPVNTICSLMLSCFGVLSSDTSNIPLTVLNRLEKDIRSVTERFDKKHKEAFATLKSVVGEGSESVKNKQRDGLFLGREEVKQEIMEKILRPSDDRVDVDVICGMDTTLAQSIYNDERVEKVPRKWLCVESMFCAEKVIKEIIGDSSTDDVESLQKKLVEKFEGNRFLIVLDDVWDAKGNEWNLLFDPLTEVGKGGLIIITRGEKEVYPALINIQMAYKLQPLSQGIFGNCTYLKSIGEDIVVKLDGHPLALKVVGRSLLNKDSSTLTDFPELNFSEDDEVMSALRWSYNHLPPHLKTCFTCCALFPKDHVFYNEKELVQMWMAHDLIEKEEQERPEDVGAQYFEELVNASLLECVDDGKHVVHDLIHDLALLVSNGEFAAANGSLTNDQMKQVRHITITRGEYSKVPSLCKMEKLLTLYIADDEIYDDSFLDDVCNQLKSIRVLVLDSRKITDIPDCISELRHLRYLDVSGTRVQSLPDSLCHLYNLQMLAAPLDELDLPMALPIDIVNVSNLRYVRAKLATCKGVGKLTSLQELSSIHVCEGDNIRELGDMQILRGKLRIEGLENVSTLEGDAGALMEKQILMDELELNFDEQLEKSTISENVLDSLGCPPNLTYLKISGYTGVKSPSWMVDRKHKFDKLHTLELSHCPKLEFLPPLGELTSLRYLFLRDVGVKRLGDEFYGKFTDDKVFFPSLEWLDFKDMKGWEEWDDIIIETSGMSFFPRLTRLEVIECPKLVSLLLVVKNCTSKRKREDKHSIMNTVNFMTSLSRLEIRDFDGLKRLQLDALVFLKELKISNCSSLVQITSAICEWLEIKSKLQTLELYDCPKLESLPLLGELTSLSRLKICDCYGLKRLQLDALVSLKELEITRCSSLVQITSAICERLQIRYCKLLEKMDVARCHSLDLYECASFRSLSIDIHGLDSLEDLSIHGCPKLELAFEDRSSSPSSSGNSVAVPLCNISTGNKQVFRTLLHHELVSLESLDISNLGGFENFDETEANNFCKLRSLKNLQILHCMDLSSLPTNFHKLSSLEELYIRGCPQLQSMPADGLPPSLSYLSIYYCPLLYERCKDESGLDWHKINHIRSRQIR